MEGETLTAFLDDKDNVCIMNAKHETVYETGVWGENLLDLKPGGVAIEKQNQYRIYRSPQEKFIISFPYNGDTAVVELLSSALSNALQHVEC
jgi:hypothetical protein